MSENISSTQLYDLEIDWQRFTDVTIPAGTTYRLTMNCPSGKVLINGGVTLGGGAGSDLLPGVMIASSFPMSDPGVTGSYSTLPSNYWVVDLYNSLAVDFNDAVIDMFIIVGRVAGL